MMMIVLAWMVKINGNIIRDFFLFSNLVQHIYPHHLFLVSQPFPFQERYRLLRPPDFSLSRLSRLSSVNEWGYL